MAESPQAPGEDWLGCSECSRQGLTQLVNCPSMPCGLQRRPLRINVGLETTAGGTALTLLGLLLIAGPGGALWPAFAAGWRFALLPLLACLVALAILGLILLGVGLFLLLGGQTELMQPDRRRAALTFNLAGRVMGGRFFSEVRKVEPDLPLWPEGLEAASLWVVQPTGLPLAATGHSAPALRTGDNAAEVLEAALLGLLAQGLIELWVARSETWIGNWQLRSAHEKLFFRPAPGLSWSYPLVGLEGRLLKLLQAWELLARLGRGPVGLSIEELVEEFFERQKLRNPRAAFCERIRRESPWLEIAEGGRFFPLSSRIPTREALLESFHNSRDFWWRAEPDWAAELVRQAEAALSRRET